MHSNNIVILRGEYEFFLKLLVYFWPMSFYVKIFTTDTITMLKEKIEEKVTILPLFFMTE